MGDASPFLMFTPAVMIAAFYGGPVAGVFATLASAFLGSHFFLPAIGEPVVEKWDRVALFLLVGVLLTSSSAVLRTMRKRLAESLWREQKARAHAEAANQAKDDFLAMVSHELQTPTSVVLGWASMIRTRQLHGVALQHAVDTIERNARVQSKLVEDVLDTSRIVSGNLRFEPRIVSLSTVVSAAVEQVRATMDTRHLRVDFDLADEDWPVLADPVRLQQVFTNLLSNAAKFTPEWGRVTVNMSRTATHARVVVSDTGVGIAPDFLPRMFQRFEQDSHTLAHSRRGLGLGLSIARHFVERQGGTIRAASEGPGKGSNFTVTLPLERRQLRGGEAFRPRLAADALRSISILLVDDDDDTRLLLANMLERYGARVTTARSASQALGLLGHIELDVVLSDLRMPGQDGFALMREIRRQPDGTVASLPAAALTVSRRSEDREHALSAGYQLHLQKPVDPDELAAAVLALTD
jgi:signal transduction histidine kinase/ActR/RegA family two-component response regulator